ncbi:apolipoprotein N-acyltransferase [Aquincola sp. MAHUQ-54]|uniref:Apolipoprotein N-acyltransferase n=1 Tax=Aquincola agrisoli TaxID=3119538 RepID=A0AAW9QJT2_9BURK
MAWLAACAAAGAAAPLGWAPSGWWHVAIAGYAVLALCAARTRHVGSAGLAGLAFGLGLHLTGHGWAYEALHRQAGVPVPAAAAATLLFVLYLALFTAVPCLAWGALRQRTGRGAWAALPALLVLGEMARGVPFNGFTSLTLGYALIDTPWAGLAPVAGVYALSLVGLAIAAGLAWAATAPGARLWKVGAVSLASAAAGALLQSMAWVQPFGTPMRYALVQTNVAQEDKFRAETQAAQMRRSLHALTTQAATLVVTPETALPVMLADLPADAVAELRGFVERSGSHVMLGIATTSAQGRGHNSVVHVPPHGAVWQQYHKVRLMPFGEYDPAGFGWFGNELDIALKDLTPGPPDQPPFVLEHDGWLQRIGTLICHEELGSGEALRWASAGPQAASVLINPSNLAWFDGSAAIAQRHQIARMRALEAGRPVLRVANTGITAHIDERGRVLRALPLQQEAVLAGSVQGMQGQTPLTRWREWPVLMICAALVLGAAARRPRRA